MEAWHQSLVRDRPGFFWGGRGRGGVALGRSFMSKSSLGGVLP